MASLSREETASKYGKALFDYANDANQLELVHEEMNILKQVLEGNPKVLMLLSNPILSIKQKKDFLIAFTTELSEESKNFLNFLVDYNRFGNLEDIILEFDNIYNCKKQIADGIVVTAYKLDSTELEKISKTYSKKFGLKELLLTNKVDKSILGGVILSVGDQVIDGSVKRKLQNIRKQIN